MGIVLLTASGVSRGRWSRLGNIWWNERLVSPQNEIIVYFKLRRSLTGTEIP